MIDEVKKMEILKAVIATSEIIKSSCYLNKLKIAEELLQDYIRVNYNVKLNISPIHDSVQFEFEEINKG